MVKISNVGNKLLLFGIVTLAATFFSGCSGGSYGRLLYSPDVTRMFLQKETAPGYNYYYDGREAIPYAVVGLRGDYVLASEFWTPVKSSGQFERLLDFLYGSDISNPRGAEILDPEGNQIGSWFSVYIYTRIKFGPDNQVNIFSPYTPTERWIF